MNEWRVEQRKDRSNNEINKKLDVYLAEEMLFKYIELTPNKEQLNLTNSEYFIQDHSKAPSKDEI